MTGKEAFRQALRLLNYTDNLGEPDSRRQTELYKRSLAVVNQIVAELGLAETGAVPERLTSLQQEVPLSERAARLVLPYGIAMLTAAAQNDGDNQAVFAALYDGRRTACCQSYVRRTDVLPRGCDT